MGVGLLGPRIGQGDGYWAGYGIALREEPLLLVAFDAVTVMIANSECARAMY